jgi:hypothetical protein
MIFLLLFVCCFWNCLAYTAVQQPPFPFSINFSPIINITLKNTSKNTSSSDIETEEVSTTVPTPEPVAPPAPLAPLAPPEITLQEPPVFVSSETPPWLYASTCAGVVGCAYGVTMITLLMLSKAMDRTCTWARWRSDVPTAALYEIPTADIVAELQRAMHEKYNRARKKDAFALLSSFMRDVKREMNQCNKLLSLHEWINSLYLAPFFPKQKKSIEFAQNALNRLTFLKEIVLQNMIMH